jgi:hypothetical protein
MKSIGLAARGEPADERLLKAVAETRPKRAVAAGVQLYLWRSACAGAGARQNRHHHLACHPSVEAEIEHRPDAGLLAASGAGGDCAGRGGAFAAAASGAPAALSSFWLEKGSYLLVGVLGLILCWRALKKLRALLQKPTFTAFTPHHVHDEHCGCGHQHLPTQEQLQNGDDWRARLMIVLSMGMRPCSGAIMVLLFSKVIGVFGWGMAAALAMAAGTSLTISRWRCWFTVSVSWRSNSARIKRRCCGAGRLDNAGAGGRGDSAGGGGRDVDECDAGGRRPAAVLMG